MSRNKLIEKLYSEGKTDEQILSDLIQGTDTVKPIKGEDDKTKMTFAKLILGKYKKSKKQ